MEPIKTNIKTQQSDYFKELMNIIIKEKPSKDQLSKLKLKLCSKYNLKHIPTDIEILLNADKSDIEKIKKCVQTKPGRSLSGVSVVAIMTRPHKCPHGKCITCPGGLKSKFGDTPQSYTGTEPATKRAMRNNFDPYLQVFNRLEQYIVTGHNPEKIELIIMGGTFMSTSKMYRDSFIKFAFCAMNDFSKMFYKKNGEFDIIKFKDFFELPGDIQNQKREKRIMKNVLLLKKTGVIERNLLSEQMRNEKAKVRCVGLTIETRPDYGLLIHGNEMLRLGATRVEIGIQSVYEKSLQFMNRDHTIQDNINSIKILKDLGFKINVHYMPGLNVLKEKDLAGLRELFSNPNYRPDMLKIYPCMVIPGTKLYELYKNKKYIPLTTVEAAAMIGEFKRYVPKYCRIMRVQRDIPTNQISAGVDRTNLRQYVTDYMKKNKIQCNCIRCREIGRSVISEHSKDFKDSKYINNSKNSKYILDSKDFNDSKDINDSKDFKYINDSKDFKYILDSKDIKDFKDIKDSKDIKDYKINVTEYDASCGQEFFISADMGNSILGFCRLRFAGQSLRKEITHKSALVRELHVYGEALKLGAVPELDLKNHSLHNSMNNNFLISQHKGIGKKLLKKAEELARQNGKNKIVVISGIGVREYYRKQGYHKEGPYMVKKI